MDVIVKNLSMRYHDATRDVVVFDKLSHSVAHGSSLAIVGKSGVGKTTLLYLISALDTPTSGEVVIGGRSLFDGSMSAKELTAFRGKNIGFVFQFHYLLPEFDALENVAMPLVIQGVDRAQALEEAAGLLQRVGLANRATHRPGALSGGEQQRVALARAFVGKPGLVLADEPTGSLDFRTSEEIIELLGQLQRERNITLIVVTHSLELAKRMDRVMELTPAGIVPLTN